MVIIIQALIGVISVACSFTRRQCCPLSGYVEICQYEPGPVSSGVALSNERCSPFTVNMTAKSSLTYLTGS